MISLLCYSRELKEDKLATTRYIKPKIALYPFRFPVKLE